MRDPLSGIEAGATTHIGKVRKHNEDNYILATPRGFWAVADGMGGHEAGDVASQVVIEELEAIAAPSTAAELLASCEASMTVANRRLKELSKLRNGALVGTTVAVLLVFETFYAGVWSGDSRIYRIRRQLIEQITLDHSEIQELISEGKINAEEARTWPRRNVITRAIGVSDNPELEMKSGTLEPGDIFILCTDGLTAHVEDSEILALASQHRPQEACDLLVGLTLERGAEDNVTVVAVRVECKIKPSTTASASVNEDIWK
jgi:serine/threonine protein phosphatase PrpC